MLRCCLSLSRFSACGARRVEIQCAALRGAERIGAERICSVRPVGKISCRYKGADWPLANGQLVERAAGAYFSGNKKIFLASARPSQIGSI